MGIVNHPDSILLRKREVVPNEGKVFSQVLYQV